METKVFEGVGCYHADANYEEYIEMGDDHLSLGDLLPPQVQEGGYITPQFRFRITVETEIL